MKKMYLASSIEITAAKIARDIGAAVSDLKTVFIPIAAEVEEGDLSWLENDKQGLIKVGFNLVNFLAFPYWGDADYFAYFYLSERIKLMYNWKRK